MAAGKVTESPFKSEMAGLRAKLDQHLKDSGRSPDRRDSDVSCEIQFRRLQAMLDLTGDEDWEYLTGLVESGVRLGVGVELPWTPQVFEEKTKWTVDATEEDLHEILRQC